MLSFQAICLLSIALMAASAAASTYQRGPNFIVMQPDDLEFFEEWTPPAHFDISEIVENPSGSDLPNINSLRSGGVQMNQAYSASAMCGTSRYRYSVTLSA
jgi:arylsulfatase A-like enzyme